MPRPKGSKNKPKVDANGKPLKPAAKAATAKKTVAKKVPAKKSVKPTPALKKIVKEKAVTLPPVVEKAVIESKPLRVEKVKSETLIKKIEEEVKAVVEKAEEAMGKKPQPAFPVNQPELAPEEPAAKSSVTKAVAEDDDTDTGSHVVMVGGKAMLRKNKSNPDLD